MLKIAACLKTDVAFRERNRNYRIERIYEFLAVALFPV
jgi:hypothetical protein